MSTLFQIVSIVFGVFTLVFYSGAIGSSLVASLSLDSKNPQELKLKKLWLVSLPVLVVLCLVTMVFLVLEIYHVFDGGYSPVTLLLLSLPPFFGLLALKISARPSLSLNIRST